MRYIKILLFLIPLFSVIFFNSTSCTFDNEEDLLKNSQCDTTNIVYNDLTYIFSDICANCHSETFTYRDGIKMDNYQNVKASINTGKVWPAINHVDGVPPMPNGLPKLSDCELAQIKAWIDSGMPNN